MSASQRDIVGRRSRGAARKLVVPLLVRPDQRRRDRQPRPDRRPRHVEHHQVLRQRERARIVFADVAFDFRRGIEVVEEVKHDGLARLHHIQNLAALLRRRVRHRADTDGALFGIAGAFDQLADCIKTFVDQQIGALRVIDEETARRGVARKHEDEPVPFQPVADRTS